MESRRGALEGVALSAAAQVKPEFSPDFWRRRRVFLTGHTGFKGSWLALSLQLAGAEVAGYALAPPTEPNLFEDAHVARGMASEIGDVRDAEAVAAAVRRQRPEVVFHLAAQAMVRASYRDPLTTYSTNVMGTAHVLEAVRRTPSVKAVVVVTSDKCYENGGQESAFQEQDRLGGHDPYSNSKACAELVTAAYRDSFFSDDPTPGRTAVASARAGNVIGGGDWAAERLVPDAMRAFLAGRVLPVRHPGATRPWQHVLEPVGGYLKLAQSLLTGGSRFAGAWNFGPHPADAQTVGSVLDQLTQLWGCPRPAWRHQPDSNFHEARFLALDCTKAHSLLDWQPVWPLSRGLEATVAWYKAFQQGKDLRQVTERQIGEFALAAGYRGVAAQ